MILVDANILLYAYDSDSVHHERARAWVEEAFSGPVLVRIPWLVVWAFLRIGTNPRALHNPFGIEEAVAIVAEWFEQPNVAPIGPGDRHWEILTKLVAEAQARGPLLTDAALAALAIEHGAELCSSDADFRRFPELRFRNPLAV